MWLRKEEFSVTPKIAEVWSLEAEQPQCVNTKSKVGLNLAFYVNN